MTPPPDGSESSTVGGTTPDDTAGQEYVVVLGAPRSGTTLLRAILDSHPDLAGGPETPWVAGPYGATSLFDLFEMNTSAVDGAVGNLTGVDEETVIRASRQYLDTIMSVHRAAQGARYTVLKTPGAKPEFLMRLLPGAKFLHVLRDGRDVAWSWFLHHHRGASDREAVLAMPKYLGWWCTMEARIERAVATHRPAVFDVRYEDLVTGPEQVIAAVGAFLGIEFPPGAERYWESDHEYPSWEHGSNDVQARASIDPSSVGAWRTRLPGWSRAYLAARYGGCLTGRGYPLAPDRDRDAGSKTEQKVGAGRYAIHGARLALRRKTSAALKRADGVAGRVMGDS